MRFAPAIAVTALVITAAVSAAQQRRAPAAAPPLPPISMTCPHHPDVLESKAGVCPVCKLPLVPVRLDSAWMCPVHTTVIESSAGSCRMCRRQLVPVTVSLTWTCAADRTVEQIEPGTCADGSARVGQRTLRAHGNHNPQHGGQFFMAPDNWHHIEGVHPSARLFRLFVYDDYGRPLSDAKVKAMAARVVTKEVFDPATRKTTEMNAFPLKPVPNRPYLEARIAPAMLPAQMTAKVKFGNDQPEYRFDFTFASLSKEPALPSATATRRPPAGLADPRPPGPSDLRTLGPSDSRTFGPSDPLTPAPIPVTLSGMIERLELRQKHVSDLIARGELTAVSVPAFEARDIAIALEPQIARLSPDRRDAAEAAVARVVRTAWLLDAAGDVGNREQIDVVHSAFKTAVTDLLTALGGLK